MSLSNSAETNLLALIFNNTNWPAIGDATGLRGSTAAGGFFISLHTADPGEAGTQSTSETAYTGYARISVVRTVGGWTIAGANATNAAAITFGTCTALPGAAISHFGIGTDTSGVGTLIFKGTAAYTVSTSNAPNFPIGAMTTTAD